ncbi:MAG: ABC transporter ATP-binding protein [Proteobacteria bacterium]|nr:ABC transporter ATP-binding protein [Pseudomonadota bacterium]
MSALHIAGLVKRFGALTATDDLNLSVAENELHAIIGPNGAGKSTLIGQITGEIQPNSGTITMFHTDVTRWSVPQRSLAGLARSFQITQLCQGFTAEDNVALAIQARQGSSFRFFADARKDRRLRDPARAALARVGLADRADRLVEELSHGEKRQLEIAITLAMTPRLILLDEPMAGMSHDESQKIVALLSSLKGTATIVLIEHDMDAVFALADRLSVLVSGRIIATGTAEEIRVNPDVRDAYLGGDA